MTTANRRSVHLVAAVFSAFLNLGCVADAAAPAAIHLTSEAGSWSAFALPEPNPAHVGGNALRFEMADQAGKPVGGAHLEVFAWMPAHGHAMRTPPIVAEGESGVYRVEQLDYPMPGQWQVRIDVTAPDAKDRFSLALDVH